MTLREEQIALAVDRLDTRDADQLDAAWAELRPLGYGVVPYLLAAYPRFRTWQGRTAMAYHATRYARISTDAVELGLLALADKSYMVRYRACGLLAYALDSDALAALDRVARHDPREMVAHSALAAMNAIKAGNHNLFADRSLSGRTSWSVNPGDAPVGAPTTPLPSRIQRMRLGIMAVPTSSG